VRYTASIGGGVKASTRQRAKQQRHAMLENLTAGRQNNVADVSAGRMKAYRPLLSLDFPLSHPTQVRVGSST